MKQAIATLLLISYSELIFCSEDISCRTAEECNNLGTIEYKKKNYDLAKSYYLKQVDISEYNRQYDAAYLAYNNVALTYYQLGNPLMANAWVDLVIRRDPGNRSAKYNQALFKKDLPVDYAKTSFKGTYGKYAGLGQWSTLKILPLNNGEFEIELFSRRYGRVPSANFIGPAAFGILRGTGYIRNSLLILEYRKLQDKATCNVSFEVNGNYILASQHNHSMDCSYGGANIYADGKYILLEHELPKINEK